MERCALGKVSKKVWVGEDDEGEMGSVDARGKGTVARPLPLSTEDIGFVSRCCESLLGWSEGPVERATADGLSSMGNGGRGVPGNPQVEVNCL